MSWNFQPVEKGGKKVPPPKKNAGTKIGAMLCHFVLFCAILCHSVLFCAILCHFVTFCALCCFVPFCDILCCFVLFFLAAVPFFFRAISRSPPFLTEIRMPQFCAVFFSGSSIFLSGHQLLTPFFDRNKNAAAAAIWPSPSNVVGCPTMTAV